MDNKCVANGLASMTREVRKIAESEQCSNELIEAAETALQSLIKSSAIHGFKLVTENKDDS